jgi:signal transduction histidine kinase
MLYEFIENHREEIQSIAYRKSLERGGVEASPEELGNTTTLFIAQVLDQLRQDAGVENTASPSGVSDSAENRGAALHDRRRSPSEIVFDYGAVCDAITTVAIRYEAGVTAQEYRTLNLLIDGAVASALEGYSRQRSRSDAERRHERTQELGEFSHELRNVLNTALFAYGAIERGPLAVGSRTGQALGRALSRMRDLIDRSLVEVRLDAGLQPSLERIDLRDLFDELCAMVEPDAVRRALPIEVEVERGSAVEGDRHLLVSAMSNLLQNAIKYTQPDTRVWLRARTRGAVVVIEVEDRCGGLPEGRAEELFTPFTQKHVDRSGLGLGLSIVHRVAESHGGRATVRNLPGVGCVFALELPRAR